MEDQAIPLTRVEELSLLAMLHAEYPDADTIRVLATFGSHWAVEVVEDGCKPIRFLVAW